MWKRFLQRITTPLRDIYKDALADARLEVMQEQLAKHKEQHLQAITKPQNYIPHARDVVEQVYKDGIEWYDWNDGSIDQRRRYYTDAQYILHTEIFHNIINYLIATGAKTALLEKDPNSGSIRDFQMTINGMKLIKEELESIVNPDEQNVYADHNPGKKKPQV